MNGADNNMIRLLVVDHDSARRARLGALLANIHTLHLIGFASDGSSAMPYANQADVVLAQADLPGEGTLELLRALDGREPVKAIVVGLPDSPDAILPFVEAGAVGYVRSDASKDELVQAIFAAERGEACVSPEVGAALVRRMNELARLSRWSNLDHAPDSEVQLKLTSREREVLILMAQGKSNQDIARELVIEHGTVKNHVHSILKKLSLNSRSDAARYFTVLNSSALPS